MITEVNHIGICVDNIDRTIELWGKAFGAVVCRPKAKFAGQISCMISIGSLNFELMEPDGAGVVSKFLEKHGEGIHHISLKSNDYDTDCNVFTETGMSYIPFPGKVGFIKPKGNHGVLCEVSTGDME